MLILGNAVAMIGCTLMVLVGFLRKKEQILIVQCFQFGFLSAGNLILGGVTGFISGVVSIVRNLVFTRTGGSKNWKIAFTAIQTVLTFLTGWPGLLGCLPLASGIILTWSIDAKSDVQFKIALSRRRSHGSSMTGATGTMWPLFLIFSRFCPIWQESS